MAFTRIFRPVGHGAFYIEKHELKDSTFTIDYDCGSNNKTLIQ